jgi:hypothetical protein
MMFVIRDAFLFSGLLPEKKNIPARDIRLAMYKFNLLTEKNELLNKEIAHLEE